MTLRHVATINVAEDANEDEIEHLLDLDGADAGLTVEPSEKKPQPGIYEVYKRVGGDD